jgi:chromosomal replication initiation ATPase DnaA
VVTGYLAALVEDAAREAGCTVAQMLGDHTRRYAKARQRAMRDAFDACFSAEQIGRAFNRHHSTVLYAAGRLTGKRPRYPYYPQAVPLCTKREHAV